MNYEKLLNEMRIEKVERTEFDLSLSEKDIDFAINGMKTGNYSRVMVIAYEAVLRAGNRLMNFLGYRAIGKEHHKNVFEFLRHTNVNKELIDYFDNIRKKRNAFVYLDIENISKEEVEEVIEKSKEFVHEIRTFVQRRGTEKNNADKVTDKINNEMSINNL